RLAAKRRRLRRQQHRRLRRARGRYYGSSRRRDPFIRRVPDRLVPPGAFCTIGACSPPPHHGRPCMSYRLRAATPADLEPIYEMAKLTGGGFTNLPPDRKALAAKLERTQAAWANEAETLSDEQFVLVLERPETGEVRGTCQMM